MAGTDAEGRVPTPGPETPVEPKLAPRFAAVADLHDNEHVPGTASQVPAVPTEIIIEEQATGDVPAPETTIDENNRNESKA